MNDGVYAKIVIALGNCLDAMDEFCDWIAAPDVVELDQSILDKFNSAKERARATLDDVGAFDDQTRN